MSRDNRFDFLRLLAAWLVLFNHAYPISGLPGPDAITRWFRLDTSGGLGVAIFFSVSGFLVTTSLQNCRSLEDFVRRRFLRIYPALLTVCLLCVLVLGPLVTRHSLVDYWSAGSTWNYLQTASGFKIRYPLPGVFEGHPMPMAVNGSLWSLPIELRCYVALAMLGLCPWTLRAKTLLAVGILAGLLVLRPMSPPANFWAPFFELNYFDNKLGLMFAIGAALAVWRDRISVAAWNGMGASALLLLSVAWWLPVGRVQLVLYTLAAPLGILWLALRARFLPKIPEKMGDWSYGTYLYAFPLQQLLTSWQVPALGLPVYLLCSTVLTFACAACSWHWVEQPAILKKYQRVPV